MVFGSDEELHFVQDSKGGEPPRIQRSLWMIEEIQKSLQLMPDGSERRYSMLPDDKK